MTTAAPVVTQRERAFLRHLAGFALAPAVAPIALVAFEAARVAVATGGFSYADAFRPGALVPLVTGFVELGYAVALVLGVPIVLALRVARRLTTPWIVGVSAVAAAAFLLGVAFATTELPPDAETLLFAGIAALLAAAVSGAYCAIAGVPPRRALARSSPAGPV